MFGDELGAETLSGHPHVGVAYLISVLKQANIDVQVYDETAEVGHQSLHTITTSYCPDLIGVTAFSYSINHAIDIIAKLKEDFTCPIVIGGPHVSATRAKALADTQADFAIKGEGETTLIELIHELDTTHPDFKTVAGLIWRTTSEIIDNKDRELIQDLDSLPFPDYEAFKLEKYTCTISNTLPIITSRGCPYGCIFCSVRLSFGQHFRARSAENVVDEMQYWYKKGWSRFEINDDCFSYDIDRAIKICDLIMERGINIKYELYNGIRADRTTMELLRKMKGSGCTFISYGCEAGNDQTLRTIRKGLTLDHIRKAVDMTNSVGIRNSVNFIIGHPGETYETARQSISFAKSLPTNFVNFYNLVPYPGTALMEWVEQNTTILVSPDSYLAHVSYRDTSPIFETSEFTKHERTEVLKEGFALYERTVLQHRLGNSLGYLAYLITRIELVDRFAKRLALYNKTGKRIFMFLSMKSRV